MADISSSPLGVGVIGLGFMGQTHVRAYAKAAADGHSCRLVAVADGNADRRAGKPGSTGNSDATSDGPLFDPSEVNGYADVADLLDDDAVEVVSICTPTDTHVALAEQALRAGKHVLVEKPVAVATERIEQLAEIADETGRTCMPAMCMRFWPGWTQLFGDAYGKLQSLSITRISGRPTWSDFYADTTRSGGALLDLHVHDTDFLCALLGTPAAVTSVGSLDALTTLYHYDEGPARVTAEGGWHHEGTSFRMRFLAVFDDATLDFDGDRDTPLLVCRDGKAEPFELPDASGYDGEIRHFIDSVATGRTPSPTLADAVATHRVLDAERQSVGNHCRVTL